MYIYSIFLIEIKKTASASSVLFFIPQFSSMGRFNPNSYKSTDYAREIDRVRSDLESDHPNARVFINFADDGSPSVRCSLIILVPLDS